MSFETNANKARFFCERHPAEEASLICGGCAKRICTICLTLTGEGVRCPDCMARLNGVAAATENIAGTTTTGYTYSNARPDAHFQTQAASRRPIPPRTTGFRTYGPRVTPRSKLEPGQYLLAIVGAFGSALVVGLIWGLLLGAPPVPNIYATRNSGLEDLVAEIYHNSVHFLPEIVTGVVVSEAMARLTHDRRGPEVQIIATLGVLFGYVCAIATLLVRLYLSAGAAFLPLDALVGDTFQVVNSVLTSGGVAIVVFWGLGIVMAVYRLKR